eukprot:10126521-Lingulodinium_polyedra.AAC.1
MMFGARRPIQRWAASCTHAVVCAAWVVDTLHSQCSNALNRVVFATRAFWQHAANIAPNCTKHCAD